MMSMSPEAAILDLFHMLEDWLSGITQEQEVLMLDALTHHVREELGYDGGGDPSRCECKSLAILVDDV